jgi:hypothetical protein
MAGPLPAAATVWNEIWKEEKEAGRSQADAARGRIIQLAEGCET